MFQNCDKVNLYRFRIPSNKSMCPSERNKDKTFNICVQCELLDTLLLYLVNYQIFSDAPIRKGVLPYSISKTIYPAIVIEFGHFTITFFWVLQYRNESLSPLHENGTVSITTSRPERAWILNPHWTDLIMSK